jgi:hypothetical protein
MDKYTELFPPATITGTAVLMPLEFPIVVTIVLIEE